MYLTYDEIIKWLKTEDTVELEKLWKLANQIRHDYVGDEVHLRGLIEFSNICCRECGYCGLNVSNKNVDRYRMTMEEVVACAKQAQEFGYGTVVLQSGEDFGITQDWMVELIGKIKQQTNLAITLSLGERTKDELKAWKEAGADRYLLRFETSDPDLYKIIHPVLVDNSLRHRIAILRELKELGYEVGSGVMVGIPGQSYAILARDILLFAELDLDMIGVGPFLPHPNTLLGQKKAINLDAQEQVPNTELMTYKVVALTRIMCPTANIPSTTALATVNKRFGRELGLMRGANVVMPNVTPKQYREKYVIYPNKACLTEEAEACDRCMQLRINTIGRKIGKGQGGRKK
jgi:biotin synthase